MLFLLLVMVFKWTDNPSMIGLILKLAGYTYGPLLGLFAFGILTKRVVQDRLVPYIAVAAPIEVNSRPKETASSSRASATR